MLYRIFKVGILCCFFLTGCGVNILSEFGNKEADEALFFEAKQAIDEEDWTAAIEAFAEMSDEYRDKREVKIIEASAYAGRCGLNFINFAAGLAGLGTTKLFTMLMRQMTGASAQDVTDCTQAETLIRAIDATAADRTTDENVMLVFVEFAKIGSILALRADTDDDGTADWADGDACMAGNLPDAEANQIATAVGNAVASLTAIGSDSEVGSGALDGASDACDDIETALDATYNFCSVTTTTAVTANMRTAVRSLTQADEYVGLGTCSDTLANCICP